MKRLATRIAVLAGVVVLLSAGLLQLETWSDVEVSGAKFEALQARAADCDTVFVGSSYFFREISPAAFDASTAAAGAPTRSFNFGVPGMDPPETYYVIDQVLDRRPPNLKYVVIELDYFRSTVRPRNIHSRRFDYWHDTVRTYESVRGSAGSPLGWRKRAKDVATHVEAFVRRYFNVGQGREFVERWAPIGGPDDGAAVALGSNADGFVALDDDPSERTDLRRGFYAAFEEDRYAEKLEQLKSRGVADDESGAGVRAIDVEALRRSVARIEAAGVRPIFVIPPCLATRADLVRLHDEGVVRDLLVFNDPGLYPELYAPENRFDVGHLNKRGAERFTAVLAEAFVRLIR